MKFLLLIFQGSLLKFRLLLSSCAVELNGNRLTKLGIDIFLQCTRTYIFQTALGASSVLHHSFCLRV